MHAEMDEPTLYDDAPSAAGYFFATEKVPHHTIDVGIRRGHLRVGCH
jgi:hypothetical protein